MQPRLLILLSFAFLCAVAVTLVYAPWRQSPSSAGRDGPAVQRAQAPPRDGPRLLSQFNTDDLTIPAAEIQAGGPPKDGIPALTDPHVVKAGDADFMRRDDRVVVVTLGETSRAYPIRALNWHEAVNDQLDDTPFTVIYCPPCDSVSVVDRRIEAGEGEVTTLEFGISGLLHNSNVLLYDRTDDALWSQVKFEAVSGPHAGSALKHLPWEITTFDKWRREHPEGTVMSFRTGHRRDYQRNPYERYFQEDGLMFPVSRRDDRLPDRARIVGVRVGDLARAYPVDRIASAADGRVVDHLGEHRLVLEADAESGTVRVVEAPSAARTVHTFWFAWAAYHEDTGIYGEPDGQRAAGDEPSS